jgi:hypothetical protein
LFFSRSINKKAAPRAAEKPTVPRDCYFRRGLFMASMLVPRKQFPEPPLITRRTGSPVSGCFVNGSSFMLCCTSKRFGFWVFLVGMVSYS